MEGDAAVIQHRGITRPCRQRQFITRQCDFETTQPVQRHATEVKRRGSAIGVARARTDYYTKPPHYVRNEFGGSLGGPVYIPNVYNGKNRTFFFTSYEALRLVSAST